MNFFTKLVLSIVFFNAAIFYQISAQESEYDSLLNYYLQSDSVLLDQLEIELASEELTILDLIDSILETDFRFSQLSLRIGYTSNITYAGRNFGVDQQGLNAGVSYYHKTGLFADISGYWNSHIEPNYNPTITTLGYFGSLTKKWTYTVSYDHYFYQTPGDDELVYYPLTNSLNASTYVELGKFTIAGDYSFLFGQENAHRARANLMYSFSKKKLGFIDRFVFMPTASILMGNADIYQIAPVYPEANLKTRYEIRQKMFEEYGKARVNYLWHNNREIYLELEKETYNLYKDDFVDYEIISNNVFGIMNYSLSAPFYFYINNFTVALSYHYNIPVALPGEDLNVTPNSYIGASLIYNIPFMKKKKK